MKTKQAYCAICCKLWDLPPDFFKIYPGTMLDPDCTPLHKCPKCDFHPDKYKSETANHI